MFDEERCEPLLNALANYHKEYDERSKLFRDAPAHEWSSHFADAFRYLAVGWEASVEDEDVKPAPSAAVWFNPLTYQRDSGQGFSPFRK